MRSQKEWVQRKKWMVHRTKSWGSPILSDWKDKKESEGKNFEELVNKEGRKSHFHNYFNYIYDIGYALFIVCYEWHIII